MTAFRPKARVAPARVVFAALLAAASPALGDAVSDCLGDSTRRIEACSELIGTPGLDGGAKSLAFAMRALAYSLRGAFGEALADYGEAVRLDPGSAIALNNRAWVLFKLGRPAEGLGDVDRSLELAPSSPHAYDTRAHIRQSLGEPSKALGDYETAMRFGGPRIVKLYQCGLQAQGLYSGRIDGAYHPEMRRALEACARRPECDPLPADEDCRNVMS